LLTGLSVCAGARPRAALERGTRLYPDILIDRLPSRTFSRLKRR
jgi:hypothetical protein